MYKLFIGFRKLGKFDSIVVAKRYAQESGITGAFNLIGSIIIAIAGIYISDQKRRFRYWDKVRNAH